MAEAKMCLHRPRSLLVRAGRQAWQHSAQGQGTMAREAVACPSISPGPLSFGDWTQAGEGEAEGADKAEGSAGRSWNVGRAISIGPGVGGAWAPLSGGVLSWKCIFWQRVYGCAGWSVSILLLP